MVLHKNMSLREYDYISTLQSTLKKTAGWTEHNNHHKSLRGIRGE